MNTISETGAQTGSTSMAVRIGSYVRDAIAERKLKPRERLIEADFASLFQCSRGPVREAFRSLEADGLIMTIPRRGTFVRDVSFSSVKAIMEIRGKLEALCARYIREANRSEDRALLRQRLRDLETVAVTGDNHAFVAADMALHQAVWECSRCEELVYALSVALKPFFLMAARALSPEESPISDRLKNHREYLDLIETVPDSELESAVEDFYRRTAEKVRRRTAD